MYVCKERYHHYHHCDITHPLDSLTICPDHLLLLTTLLDGTKCLHRDDECKYLLVSQYCCALHVCPAFLVHLNWLNDL